MGANPDRPAFHSPILSLRPRHHFVTHAISGFSGTEMARRQMGSGLVVRLSCSPDGSSGTYFYQGSRFRILPLFLHSTHPSFIGSLLNGQPRAQIYFPPCCVNVWARCIPKDDLILLHTRNAS
jgi:hypothetical protein